MDFERIYKEALEMYPEYLNISDGVLFKKNKGFLSTSFTKAFETAETNASKVSEWHSLFVWVIFQALHNKAKLAFSEGKDTINKDEIMQQVREFLLHNLKQEGYEEMEQEFLNYDSLRHF